MPENPHPHGSEVERVDPAALLGVVLAGVLATAFADEGPYTFGGTAIGITLLLVLHTFDTKSDIALCKRAKHWYKLPCYFTFGAVWSLCFLLVIGPLLEWQAGTLNKERSGVTDTIYIVVWFVVTLTISWLRFGRFSSRQNWFRSNR